MITIKVIENKDIEILLLEHALVIREHGIIGIKESFELGLEEAHVVEFDVDGEFVDFIIKREGWMEFLKTSIEPLLEAEDYASLVEVRELIAELGKTL